MNRSDVIESIEQWIKSNQLQLHKSGIRYAGNAQEIERAMVLLSNKDTQPKIPYKPFTIPEEIEISIVIAAVNHKNIKLALKSRWGINKTARLIYVPDDIEEEMINEFNKSVNSKNKMSSKRLHDVFMRRL